MLLILDAERIVVVRGQSGVIVPIWISLEEVYISIIKETREEILDLIGRVGDGKIRIVERVKRPDRGPFEARARVEQAHGACERCNGR